MIDLLEFELICRKIAEVANRVFKTKDHTMEHIDLICNLRDYKDGKGTVVVTMALLRNQSANGYDLGVNVVGSFSEALTKLLKELEKIEEQNYTSLQMPVPKNNNKLN